MGLSVFRYSEIRGCSVHGEFLFAILLSTCIVDPITNLSLDNDLKMVCLELFFCGAF